MINKIKSISKRVIAIILTVMMLLTSGIVGAVAASIELVETGANITTGTKLYLQIPNNTYWDDANAWYAAYFYGSNGSSWDKAEWIEYDATNGNIYEVVAPSGTWTNVIFCRMNPQYSVLGWDGDGQDRVWNQTADLTYDGSKKLYKLNDNSNEGTWYSYTPPKTEYSYTVICDPDAGGTVTDSGNGKVEQGKYVTLTATANPGYDFSGWESTGGTLSSNGATTTTFTPNDDNQTVTAKFTAKTVLVDASVSPAGAGTVTVVPANVTYPGSTTLTATANTGYRFDHWELNGTSAGTDPSLTISYITEARNYTAVFVKTYQVTITNSENPNTTSNYSYVKVGNANQTIADWTNIQLTVDEGASFEMSMRAPTYYYVSEYIVGSNDYTNNGDYYENEWYDVKYSATINADLEINVSYSHNPYLSVGQCDNGIVSFSGSGIASDNSISYKNPVDCTAEANDDDHYVYEIYYWINDDKTDPNNRISIYQDNGEQLKEKTVTVAEVTDNITFYATIVAKASTTVNFTQNGAGVVEANNTVYTNTSFDIPVVSGRSFAFEVKAPAGKYIQSVNVNGASVYSGSDENKENFEYTVSSVTGEEYPISITYGDKTPRTVTVLAYDATGGTLKYNDTAIPAAGTTITAYTGDDVIITAEPATKHVVKAWVVGESTITTSDTSYTFSNISDDHEITVEWDTVTTLTVEAKSNPGGAATTTASKSTYEPGEDPITFTTNLTDPCFKFKGWKITGSYTGSFDAKATSITLTPTTDITATATYELVYKKIYLNNAANWNGTMYVYYFNSDLASIGYPGAAMTYDQSLGYWVEYIPIDAKNVKFNNGGDNPATGDINVEAGKNIFNNSTNAWEEWPYVEDGYYLWGSWNGNKYEAFNLLKFYSNNDGTYSYDILVTSTADGYIYVIPSDEDSNFYNAATNGATGNPQTLTASGYLEESARNMIKIEIDPNRLDAKCDVRVTFNPTTGEFSWTTSMRPETIILTGTDGRQKNQSDYGWTTNDGDPDRVGDTYFSGDYIVDFSTHSHHEVAEVEINKPVTISTQVNPNASGEYDYYVEGWVVNGVGWIDANPQGNGLYTATKTFAEAATLVPVYYHTTDWLTANSTNEVTVYAVMDKSITNWDEYMSVYTWYKNSSGSNVYEQFGEYAGQLMKPVEGLDGVYTTKIETSAPGANGVNISGISFVNYGYAYNDYDVYNVVDYTHIQTYDYYEFIALNNAGKKDITFVIKNTNDTQNDDRIPGTLNINDNWDFVEFTDYSGIKTDIWATDIEDKWDSLSDENALYIIRQGDIKTTESPLSGDWYVMCHLYRHDGTKIGECYSYELSDPNATIWESLGDYKLQRCYVSYEKGRYYNTGGDTHTTRYDGQWYGDAEGVETKVKLQVQVALLPEGATEYILNETDPINEANYGKAYINGTYQSYDATRTTEQVDLNAINLSGYKFKGWYTASGAQFSTQNAETVTASVGTTYIAVFEPLTTGEFYVDHFIYKGVGSAEYQPPAHNGNAILSVQIENKTQGTQSEEFSGEGSASASLEATEGDELYITITTDGLGADKFFAWYVDAVNKNGETTFEEVGVDSDDNLYPNSGNTVNGSIDKVGFKFKYVVQPNDSMQMNLYSDLMPVSSEITLIYQYNDRYDESIKFYYVPYTLTEDEIKGFAGNNYAPLTPAYITGEGWTNTVSDNAPWISDYYKDCTWEIDVENNLYDPNTFHLIATQPPKEYTVTINTGSVDDRIEKHSYNDLLSLDANDFGLKTSSGKGFWYEDLDEDGQYNEDSDKIITYNAYYGYRVTRDIHIGYAKFDGELDFSVSLDEPVYGREQTTNSSGGNKTDKILVDYMINIITPNFYGHDGWTEAPIYKGETIEENWDGAHVTIESYEDVKNVDIEYGVIVEQFGASIFIDENDENGFIDAEKIAEERGYKTPTQNINRLEEAVNLQADGEFVKYGDIAYIKYEAHNEITNYNRVLFTIKYSNTQSNRGRFFNVYGYVKVTDNETDDVKYYFSDVRYHNIYATATQS